MEEFKDLSHEEIVKKYFSLKSEKDSIEQDIIATEKILDDKNIHYVTRTEYKNDLIYDKHCLDKINEELKKYDEYFKTNPIIEEIVNEDGTNVNDGYPVNPLEEKWKKLYPSIPKPEYSQVCDGYSCMWCDRCPRGSEWKVPEEDLELWNKYQDEIREYNRIHNPEMYQLVMSNKEKVINKSLINNNKQ